MSKRGEDEAPGKVGEWRDPCGACGNEWFWPTTNDGWVCADCFVKNLSATRMKNMDFIDKKEC